MKRFSACILKILMAVTVLLSVLSLSACKQDDFTVYFGIDSMPVNIDPQLASSYSELLTVRNCFRGLIKQDADGKPVFDTAKTLDISEDGLKYSFTVNETKWSNGEPVTANDYAYSITRVADLQANAPHYILTSNIETVTCIGNTVTYVLKEPDGDFLYKLSDPVFMPCNKDFFDECCGKYGLGKDYILCNGCYYVSAWDASSYLVMRRRTGNERSYPTAQRLYLSYGTKGKDSITRISEGEIGVTVSSGKDFSDIDMKKFNISVSYKKNYAVVFNPKSEIGASAELLTAFAKDINRDALTGKLPEKYKIATTVIPLYSQFNCKPLSSDIIENSDYGFTYSAEEARAHYLKAVKSFKNKKLPQISVLTVDLPEIKSVLTEIVSTWQSDLGAYINISTVSSEEVLMSTVINGMFDVAFVPFGDDVIDTMQMLDKLGIIGVEDIVGFTASGDRQAALLCEALYGMPSVIPVISVPTAYISEKSYKGLVFSPIDSTALFTDVGK